MSTNVFVKFFYQDLLMPDDTYRIRAQKRVIAFITPISIIPLVQILVKLARMKFGTPSETLNFFVRIVVFMSVVLLWVTTRYKRAVTDTMSHAFFLALNITYLAHIITDPNTGSEGALVAFVVGAVLFDAQSLFKLNMCLPFLTAVIMAYNKSLGRPGTGHTPFVFPGAKDLEGVELFITYLTGIIICSIALFVVHLQNKELIRLMAASTAAVSLSRDVAGKLAVYDTDGAMAILDSATDVEPDLVSSLQLVTTNLEKYRAFLPEALLQPPVEDDSDSLDLVDDFAPIPPDDENPGLVIAIPDVPYVGIHPRERSLPKRGSAEGQGLRRRSDVSSPTSSPNHSPLKPRERSHSKRGSWGFAEGQGIRRRSDVSSPTGLSSLNHSAPSIVPTLRFASGLHHRKITVMRIVFPTAHELAQGNPEAAHEFGTDMLRGVYECAQRHDGICMSLTPSSVVVCWNGHKSCLNHERHAVQCALDIVGECLVSFEGIPWTVFIAGGLGVVGTTGSDNQKSTVILGAVPHLLDLMSHLTVLYPQSVLITDKVRDVARVGFASRIVDVLSVGGASTYVFEVLDHAPEPRSGLHATDDLDDYNDGFSALQCHEYGVAAEKFLEHMLRCDVADPQAYRLYQVSTYLAAGHEWHPRVFTGWSSSLEDCSRMITVPIVIAPPSRGRPIARTVSHIPSVSEDDQMLRTQIQTLKGLRSPQKKPTRRRSSDESTESGNADPQPIPTVFVDQGRRQWRRSEKLLGSGAFGQVWLGMGNGGDLIAMKTVPIVHVLEWEDRVHKRSPFSRRSTDSSMSVSMMATSMPDVLTEVLQEVTLLSNLRDENIVGYVGSAVVDGVLIILMEYVPGGSLASLLKEFRVLDVAPTQRYVRDVVRGLCFLHRSGVLHQDVKPHNVLLMIDGQCKLTDFGASAKLGHLHGEANKVQGTPLYMAPEQCMGRACKASDVWAVGVLTYQLLTGKLPYSDAVLDGVNGFRFMYTLGRDETMVPEMPFGIPPVARAFCESIFKRDPTQRPTADELLHHPFII